MSRTKQPAQKRDFTSIIVTVVTFALSIYVIQIVGKNEASFEHAIKSAGVYGPVFTIILYGLLSLTPIPSDPLALIGGALFGPFLGIFVNWMGNNFAALIEFYLGKSVSTISYFNERKKDLPWGLNKLPVNSAWFLMGGRLVPGFGSKVVSVLAGVYGVSTWRYMWTAAVTNLFGATMYAIWGVGLLHMFK